jgi:glutamate carboxypeptidase
MDSRQHVAPRLAAPAAELLGFPVHVGARGGASDASHMAEHVELTVDGLGPRGGHAHHPDEFVWTQSIEPRASIALAFAAAALNGAS